MKIEGCAGRSRMGAAVSPPVHSAGRRAAVARSSHPRPLPRSAPPAGLNTFSEGAHEGTGPATGSPPHLDPQGTRLYVQ